MAEELGLEIAKRVQLHSTQTSAFQTDFEMFDRMYRCVPESRNTKSDSGNDRGTLSNTFVGEFFRAVETDAAAIERQMFSEDPWFTVAAMDLDEDSIQKAANTEAVLKKQAEGTAWNPKLRTKLQPALRSFCINGTAIGRVSWEIKQRWVGQGANYVQKTLVDSPSFVNVPPTRFHFDPYAFDIDSAKWVAERYPSNRKAIQALIDSARQMPGAIVRDLKEIESVLSGPAAGVATQGGTAADNIRNDRGYTGEGQDKRPVVIDYWGEHPDKDTPIDWRIVTVNGEWVIQMPNPYSHGMKPYVKACFIDLDESFYGLGLGQILKLQQQEINEFRNLSRDGIAIAIYNMWQQTGGGLGNQSKQSMKIRPGKIFRENQEGLLTPLITNLQGISPAMQLEEQTKADMRGNSAASAIQQAIPTDVSAREVTAMGNASDTRMNSLAVVWADKMVRSVLWLWHEMNKQFLTTPTVVNVPAENGPPMPTMVQGNREVVDEFGNVHYESDILPEAEIAMKMPVDGDGREGMVRRFSKVISDFTPLLEKGILQQQGIGVNFYSTLKELGRLMGVSDLVYKLPPPVLAPSAPAEEPIPPMGGDVPPPSNPSGAVGGVPGGGVSEGLTPVPGTLPSVAQQVGGITPVPIPGQ